MRLDELTKEVSVERGDPRAKQWSTPVLTDWVT